MKEHGKQTIGKMMLMQTFVGLWFVMMAKTALSMNLHSKLGDYGEYRLMMDNKECLNKEQASKQQCHTMYVFIVEHRSCSIFLGYSVFLLIKIFTKYFTFIFTFQIIFTRYFMKYCEELQNYRTNMR